MRRSTISKNTLGMYGPERRDDSGFRWDLLCGAGDAEGPDRFKSQYWVANVDPSDLYVQSLPGTDRYRLRADESGYNNLYLAGDWINCGLNAGCIESAVMSGLQAANASSGPPPRSWGRRILHGRLDNDPVGLSCPLMFIGIGEVEGVVVAIDGSE